MRHLPNPPRTEGFSDPEAVIEYMRRWFWALAETDFDFTDPLCAKALGVLTHQKLAGGA